MGMLLAQHSGALLTVSLPGSLHPYQSYLSDTHKHGQPAA